MLGIFRVLTNDSLPLVLMFSRSNNLMRRRFSLCDASSAMIRARSFFRLCWNTKIINLNYCEP